MSVEDVYGLNDQQDIEKIVDAIKVTNGDKVQYSCICNLYGSTYGAEECNN